MGANMILSYLLKPSGRNFRDFENGEMYLNDDPSLGHWNPFSMAISNVVQGQSNSCSFGNPTNGIRCVYKFLSSTPSQLGGR